jgi:hypothetical protein
MNPFLPIIFYDNLILLAPQAMGEGKMRLEKPLKAKFFAVITARVTVFFLLMGILTGFLYAIGTAQGFMDSTQLLLLRLTVWWGALLAVSSFYGLILKIIVFTRNKELRGLGGVPVYLVLGIIGIAGSCAALFIIIAAAGNA